MHVGTPKAVTLKLCCSLPQLAGPCQLQLGRYKQLHILPYTLWLAGGQYPHCNGRTLHRADKFLVVAYVSDSLAQRGNSTLLDNVYIQALNVSDNSASVDVHESRGS